MIISLVPSLVSEGVGRIVGSGDSRARGDSVGWGSEAQDAASIAVKSTHSIAHFLDVIFWLPRTIS